MTLEPCPYCGGPVRYGLGVKGAICLDPACFYEGPMDDEGAEKHNRLSRIVRAAEKWAKARRTGTMLEISETGNELLLAVEGGAEG
jgi:hypothetical protein